MSAKVLPWVEGLKPGDPVYCTIVSNLGAPEWVPGEVVRRHSTNLWFINARGERRLMHQMDIRSLAWCKAPPQPWWAGDKGRWR